MVLAEVSPKTQSKPISLKLEWIPTPIPVAPESASPLKDIPTIVDFARSADKALGIIPAAIPQNQPTERLYEFTGSDPATGKPKSMWAEHPKAENMWHGTQPPAPRPPGLVERIDKGIDKIADLFFEKNPRARKVTATTGKIVWRTGGVLVGGGAVAACTGVVDLTPNHTNPDLHPTATGAILQLTQTVTGTEFAPGMVDATAEFTQLQQRVSIRECAFPEAMLSTQDITLLRNSMINVQLALEQAQVKPGEFESISCTLDMQNPNQHKAVVVLSRENQGIMTEYLYFPPEGFVPVKRLPLDDGSEMFVRLDLLPVLFPPPTQEPSPTNPPTTSPTARASTSPTPKPAEQLSTPPNTSEPLIPPPPNTPPSPPTNEGVSTPYPPPATVTLESASPVPPPPVEETPTPKAGCDTKDQSPPFDLDTKTNDGTRTQCEWTGGWYDNGQFIPGEPPGNYAETSDGELVVIGRVISVDTNQITIQLAPGNENCNMNDRFGTTCGTITLTIGQISIFDAVQRGKPPYEYRNTADVDEIHPNAWVSVRGNKEGIKSRDKNTTVAVRLRQ